jgi:hypothetical protein
LCGRKTASEGLWLDVVRADALAVDLDHRDPLAVARLELGVVVDHDLVELEPELVAQRVQLLFRPLAEVAALRFEKNDAGYG